MHKQLACLVVAVAATVGCQVKPGDYRVYRLAVNPLSSECNPAPPEDLNHTQSDTYFQAGLVAIYASDGDTYFLESGSGAILGERSGSDYTFTGNETRTDNWTKDDGFTAPFTASYTQDVVYTLTLKGKGLSGKVTATTVQQCSGGTMDCANANAAPYSCVVTQEVFGSEVDDIDIEYPLGGGGGDIGEG